MAVKNPQATIGTMFSAAIARRIAGKPPADLREDEEVEEKAEKAAPENKDAGAAPTNKATVSAKKAPAKRKGK
jgi:hypothetical protein